MNSPFIFCSKIGLFQVFQPENQAILAYVEISVEFLLHAITVK